MTEIATDRPSKGCVPEISLKKLKQLWKTRRSTEEIAILLQVSSAYLQAFARKHNLPKRVHIARRANEKEVDPTPEEIAIRSAEVRARWTDREYQKNACHKPKQVEIRTYAFNRQSVEFFSVGPN